MIKPDTLNAILQDYATRRKWDQTKQIQILLDFMNSLEFDHDVTVYYMKDLFETYLNNLVAMGEA